MVSAIYPSLIPIVLECPASHDGLASYGFNPGFAAWTRLGGSLLEQSLVWGHRAATVLLGAPARGSVSGLP